jgi:hypothetical protein
VAALDPGETIQRTGVRPAPGGYAIDVLNETYVVDVPHRTLLRSAPQPPALSSPHLEVAVLAYLIHAQAGAPGEWVGPAQLPDGDLFFKGPHQVPVGGLMERFGTRLDGFKKACLALDGAPLPYADAAYAFKLFPHFPAAVLLWIADDEFPARVSMLVGKNAAAPFLLDALLGALHVVQDSVLAADKG